MSYQTKVYRKRGGDELVVAAGGKVTAEPGGTIQQAPIGAGAALTLTRDQHDGKTVLLDHPAGSVVTLQPATGSGARFKVLVSVAATSNSHKVQVANAADILQGLLFGLSDDGTGGPVKGWETAADSDTVTWNRTTTGTAKIGHWIELEDIKANVWAIRGQFAASGTEASPFSAAVS